MVHPSPLHRNDKLLHLHNDSIKENSTHPYIRIRNNLNRNDKGK